MNIDQNVINILRFQVVDEMFATVLTEFEAKDAQVLHVLGIRAHVGIYRENLK